MQSMKRKLADSNDDLKNCKIKKEPEQEFINYISIPSLKSIAVVNVAIGLWQQFDIKDDIQKRLLLLDPVKGNSDCNKRPMINCSEILNEIEKNILNKISLLPIPDILKVKVSYVITPMKFEIVEWIRSDHRNTEYMNSIIWTPIGTLDRVKTLKQLINKDSGKSITTIYQTACTHCLEDSIPILWRKLPEKIQNYYVCCKTIYEEYHYHLIAYWISIATNELHGFISKIKPNDHKNIYNCSHSVNMNMFTLAVLQGNSLAVKYFWKKLTSEEIISNMARWINYLVHSMDYHQTFYQLNNEYADVLFFLLSNMNDAEQQQEIFQKNSSVLLNSLLSDWPWQRFLLRTIRAMWHFLDKNVYIQLLTKIVREIKECKIIKKVLIELWCDSPIHLKDCFIQYFANPLLHGSFDVLCYILAMENIGANNVILKDVAIEEKKNIIIAIIENRSFLLQIFFDKIPLFNILIAEAMLQESEIKELKERIVQIHGKDLCTKWILGNNWQLVEKFFNWVLTSQEQIDYFKNKIIDKFGITYSLLEEGNYKSVNQFINWCFTSEQEIKQFKNDFATSNHEIIEIGYHDFCSFEKFVAWCFGPEQEINEFKLDILHSHEMPNIIFSCITRGSSEFIDKFINWCCHSNEEVKQFKSGFILSEKWMELLQRFVNNGEYYTEVYGNWEWIRKLIKLFCPLEEELKIQLKEKITTSVIFQNFSEDSKCPFRILEKHVLRLLDNPNYNVGDDESNNNNWSDGNHDACNYYDEDAAAVLNKILNKVESGLLEENIP